MKKVCIFFVIGLSILKNSALFGMLHKEIGGLQVKRATIEKQLNKHGASWELVADIRHIDYETQKAEKIQDAIEGMWHFVLLDCVALRCFNQWPKEQRAQSAYRASREKGMDEITEAFLKEAVKK